MSEHPCPIHGCPRRVPHYLLMCSRHWRQVPLRLQRTVYSTWDDGRGYGTPEHIDAMDAAIAAVQGPMPAQGRLL